MVLMVKNLIRNNLMNIDSLEIKIFVLVIYLIGNLCFIKLSLTEKLYERVFEIVIHKNS